MQSWTVVVLVLFCIFSQHSVASRAKDLSAREKNLLGRILEEFSKLENNNEEGWKNDNSDMYPVRHVNNGEFWKKDEGDVGTSGEEGQTSKENDPAEEEEELENEGLDGGKLLDKDEIDPDSTLAKMIESMKVEENGKELTPKGEHPDHDEKQRENSLDRHKYTPLQRALKRNFDIDEAVLWEGGIVPYEISGVLAKEQNKKVIEKAIAELNRKTCLKIVPKDSPVAQNLEHNSYIKFVSEKGCWSYVGNLGDGMQLVSLEEGGCVSHATVIHEILHAIGMQHEQSRADRDKYIKIITENIEAKEIGQFNKEKTSDKKPYDYESVMQYNLYSFGKKDSSGNDKKTMEFHDQNLEFLADLDEGLDFYDVADITEAYKCTAHCQQIPDCQNGGFVDHTCKCFCPNGLKGDNCELVDTPDSCGGIVEVPASFPETITSPNWPDPYPAGIKCTWLIRAQQGESLTVTLDEFEFPFNTENYICYHWLEVRYNLIGQLGPKRCGYNTNEIWKATPTGNPNIMMLRMDSKFSPNEPPLQGFTATITAS